MSRSKRTATSASSAPDEPPLSVRPLTPDDWPTIERLFGPQGACAGCWCMFWRVRGRAWSTGRGATHRAAFRELVRCGRVHGVLAFAGDEPVGWCNVGPREDFPRLEASRVLATGAPPSTWGVLCFFVPPRWRRRGVAAALLARAVELARERGAVRIEGYPVRPGPNGRIAAAFAWTGVPRLFERARFREAPGVSPARPIFRRVFRRAR